MLFPIRPMGLPTLTPLAPPRVMAEASVAVPADEVCVGGPVAAAEKPAARGLHGLAARLATRICGLLGGPAAAVASEAAPPPEPVAQPVPSVNGPAAILPNGQLAPPTFYRGGFHGTTDVPPEVALRDGLPARGDDWRLAEHTMQEGSSAFRGTTEVLYDPVNGGGAAAWAGEGGWVYEIRGVPTWDVNTLLEGRVRTPGGFRGNLMYGENELAIPARVPPEHIKRYGRVEEDSSGHLRVRTWVDNPGYVG